MRMTVVVIGEDVNGQMERYKGNRYANNNYSLKWDSYDVDSVLSYKDWDKTIFLATLINGEWNEIEEFEHFDDDELYEYYEDHEEELHKKWEEEWKIKFPKLLEGVQDDAKVTLVQIHR